MRRLKKRDTNRTIVIGFRVSHAEADELDLLKRLSGKHLSKCIRDAVMLGARQRIAEITKALAASRMEGHADAA